jgi:hypothetical protein
VKRRAIGSCSAGPRAQPSLTTPTRGSEATGRPSSTDTSGQPVGVGGSLPRDSTRPCCAMTPGARYRSPGSTLAQTDVRDSLVRS